MSTFPSIRAAVIGFGLGGRVFHCPFLSAVPGLELVGIVQRHGDTASVAYPQATIYRTAEEVFAAPEIDLVSISTPNDTHFSLARAALEAGKHVVLDKPISTTSAEVRVLMDLARERRRILAPFQNRRYDGDFRTLRKLLKSERLGRPVQIISRLERFRPEPRAGSWKERGSHGNGLLFDLGPHLIDQAIALFGHPQRVSASVRRDRDRTEVDDAFSITLEYDRDGHLLRYVCEATLLSADPQPRFVAQGTRGSYIKRGVDPQEAALVDGVVVPSADAPEDWLTEPSSAWGTITIAQDASAPIRLSSAPLPTERGDYRLFYANVRDAIHGLAPLAVPPEDALLSMRLLELALASSAQRRMLQVTL